MGHAARSTPALARRIGSALITASVASAPFAGCGTSEPQRRPEAAQTHVEAFSNFGMERVIPLRFIMMANDCNNPQPYYGCGHTPPVQTTCSTCTDGATNCGPDTITIAEIKDSVEKANFALRTASVQVFVERIEKYVMPTFWVSDNGAAQPTWSQVWTQFRRPYPSVTASWPFNASDTFKEKHWGHATAIRTGNPREIIIFVAECSLGADGAPAYHGAASFIGDREIIESARAFTHEIGHVLGLDHTMHWTEPWKTPNTEDFPDEPGSDPINNPVRTDPANYWELTYGIDPSTQQIWYPSNFQDAWNWQHGSPPKTLWSKMTWDCIPPPGQSCIWNPINCVLDVSTCGVTSWFSIRTNRLGRATTRKSTRRS